MLSFKGGLLTICSKISGCYYELKDNSILLETMFYCSEELLDEFCVSVNCEGRVCCFDLYLVKDWHHERKRWTMTDSSWMWTHAGSSGSRAEANILKHVRKEWPELRDRLSVSPPDDSTTDASSPTRNNSPARAMEDEGSIEDQSRDKLMPDETLAVVPSTRKLKESLLLMAKKKKGSTTASKLADGIFISKPFAWNIYIFMQRVVRF